MTSFHRQFEEPEALLANGTGVEDKLVGWRGIVLTFFALMAMAAFTLYTIAWLWPHPTPSGLPPEPTQSAGTPATDTTATSDTSATSATSATTETTATTDTTATTGTTDPTGTVQKSTREPEERKEPTPPCKDAKYRDECECWQRVKVARGQYAEEHKDRSPLRDDPACVYFLGRWRVLWGETRLLLLVLLGGFLGAMVYSLRSFFWYVGNRELKQSWLPLYFVVPFVGSMLAFVFYVVFRGGLFSPATSVSDTSPFGFVAIAALVGMFTNQAAEKLRSIFETLMTRPPEGRDATLQKPPVLKDVEPKQVQANADTQLTVTGENFGSDTKVLANGAELTTTVASATELKATLPAAMVPNATTSVEITVDTPKVGKSSTGIKLTVQP